MAALPALLAGGAAGAGHFLDGPPPAHTGGFGEPTCAACHFDGPAGAAPELAVEGLPAEYVPGEQYRLVVRLRGAAMGAAGYQLAARFSGGAAEGGQAGSLRAADPRSAVTEDRGVQYAHQTQRGATPAPGGDARWEVRWTAPAEGSAPVAFHLAGNAADGDRSQFGDRTAAARTEVPPARSTPGGR